MLWIWALGIGVLGIGALGTSGWNQYFVKIYQLVEHPSWSGWNGGGWSGDGWIFGSNG